MTVLGAGSRTGHRFRRASTANDPCAGDLCLEVMETPNAPNSEATVADPPADLSDRLSVLLEGIARGDQAAFAEFYQLTSRRVYGMARRVLIDP